MDVELPSVPKSVDFSVEELDEAGGPAVDKFMTRSVPSVVKMTDINLRIIPKKGYQVMIVMDFEVDDLDIETGLTENAASSVVSEVETPETEEEMSLPVGDRREVTFIPELSSNKSRHLQENEFIPIHNNPKGFLVRNEK
eukprot:CAMPEP_0113527264 /NCGR_PEP_ID=MMETSP0015_2-20120614/1201_1 /TAXON_ID=2838 /ORGANISM="Odontella" /LENGTH=139 /DNA_ID=CAMNT_0000425683 /DNA_START=297 /DNA_END=716 /DNA_ORIENTATION=+ /assembly_acc=CAM_ASM_000160